MTQRPEHVRSWPEAEVGALGGTSRRCSSVPAQSTPESLVSASRRKVQGRPAPAAAPEVPFHEGVAPQKRGTRVPLLRNPRESARPVRFAPERNK